jgi:hypothetical protein
VELPAGSKFCNKCGTPVATEAPTQLRFASPKAYTPKHLAERIINSKAALEGERKQVTVLFADLKGSMELLADRDPEEARKILDPVLERMMEAVHRYEGTVNQVMGDGIMALFGAPLAHEDHAVWACYAALRMGGAAGGALRRRSRTGTPQATPRQTRKNPFFLEETVWTPGRDEGAGGRTRPVSPDATNPSYPGPAHGSDDAGVADRSAPEDKRLLQVASVIGKDVPFTLLRMIAELSDEGLRRGLEICRRRSSSTRPGSCFHEFPFGWHSGEMRRDKSRRALYAVSPLSRGPRRARP